MTKNLIIPDEVVINKIIVIRGQKVRLDTDLAELYGIPTKRLNEQVKRNIKRFPDDFMFQLTKEEKAEVVAKCDHLKKLKFSLHLPFAFTEHGAVMLAGVLNSDRAIAINIQIVRVFNQMRLMILSQKDILLKLKKMGKTILKHNAKFSKNEEQLGIIMKALQQLLGVPEEPRKKWDIKSEKKTERFKLINFSHGFMRNII